MATKSYTKNRRVLIVEDHDGLRLLIGSYLSRNFEVFGAKNGLEAMTCLNQGIIPDIIVADTLMPELNGEQLLHHLRCSGMFGDIPVVIISENAGIEEEQHFKSLGAIDYLKKPINPLTLQERLTQCMR